MTILTDTIPVIVTIGFAAPARDGSTDPAYPLAVHVTQGDRVVHQPTACRTLREARIYANGLCFGAMLAAPRDVRWPVNPVLDPRLEDVA
jgi:hypothetical protein